MNKQIYVLNPFSLSQKLEINRLIEYSVDFPLCQRLNASFDGILIGFARFLIGRSIFGRWVYNQMMHSIVGKEKNPLSIQSNDWFQAFGKGRKGYSTWAMLFIDCIGGCNKMDMLFFILVQAKWSSGGAVSFLFRINIKQITCYKNVIYDIGTKILFLQ